MPYKMVDVADELKVLETLADYGLAIPELGRIIPAPIVFKDKAEYWATLDAVAYETRLEIETEHVHFFSLYRKSSTDDPESPKHSPIEQINYEWYGFSELDPERADENITPDAFNRLMLKRYNDFVAGIFMLKAALQGQRNIEGLSGNYAIARTNPLTVVEEIQNNVPCEFIPGISGYTIRFRELVELQLVEC